MIAKTLQRGDGFLARRTLLGGLACLATFLAFGCSETVQEEPDATTQPNIIFVLTNDLDFASAQQMPRVRSLLMEGVVDSTGRCNTVVFLVLSGSEVWVWLIRLVRGCRRCARRSCGIGGRLGSPLATSPRHSRSLPAL